jgi:hypothetical protein
MKIYTLIIINEDMQIVGTSSYKKREDAVTAMQEDYAMTKVTLKAEGWNDDDLEVDKIYNGSYYIAYGSSSYYAEIKENELN